MRSTGNVLRGRSTTGLRGTIYLYTKWSNRLYLVVKCLLLVLLSPLWLPLYIASWIGYWSELLLDACSPLVDKMLIRLIPRNIGGKKNS